MTLPKLEHPTHPTVDAVTDALRRVPYPGLTRDLVSLGMLERVDVTADGVIVTLGLHTRDPGVLRALEGSIHDAVGVLGTESVRLSVIPPRPSTAVPVRAGTPDPWADQVRLNTVRHVIAVGAGKGGVGKSTVAINLALALALEGLRVGLMDADIYGPSLPILLGIEDGAQRVRMTPEKVILPLEAHGLPMISFGFFLGEGSPAIWRGPKVSKAVKQFSRGVAWPELDVLVVDLPPGTGDIPVSLVQAVEVSGAVVVTQPARVAAAEARKAAEMFRTLEVPVLGVVENMRGAFGFGAGCSIATELDVPLLGSIPFDPTIVTEGDRGTPTLVARPTGAVAQAFQRIARGVAEGLGWRHVEAASGCNVLPAKVNA
jgi:ATP-binding protein involved in chromosome partitioning